MKDHTRQLCTFQVDHSYLGIDVEQVQEVVRYQKLTRVPLAPATVRGLMNLRGQIVTVLDLRRCLGFPPHDADELPMNVVVRDGENCVSFLVDRIGDVVEVNEEFFEPPPTTVNKSARGLIQGAYKLPDGLLLLLDTARILAECDPHTAKDLYHVNRSLATP